MPRSTVPCSKWRAIADLAVAARERGAQSLIVERLVVAIFAFGIVRRIGDGRARVAEVRERDADRCDSSGVFRREFCRIERVETREERLVPLAQPLVPDGAIRAFVFRDVTGIDVCDRVARVEELEEQRLGSSDCVWLGRVGRGSEQEAGQQKYSHGAGS